MPREELYGRIDRRVGQMLADGNTPTPTQTPAYLSAAAKESQNAQAIVLYGDSGVESIALVPGTTATGEALSNIAHSLAQARQDFVLDHHLKF